MARSSAFVIALKSSSIELTWPTMVLSLRSVLPSPARRMLSMMAGTCRRAPCRILWLGTWLANPRWPPASSLAAVGQLGAARDRGATPVELQRHGASRRSCLTVMVGEIAGETEPAAVHTIAGRLDMGPSTHHY